MSNKTRKHIWPVSLVMSIAIIGTLAAFLVLAANPGVSDAHDGPSENHCADQASDLAHDVAADIQGLTNPDGTDHTCANPGMEPTPQPTPQPTPPGTITPDPSGDMISSSSTSASATVELQLTIDSLPESAKAGSSIELYLEDDFQVPDSIDRDTVYFRVTNNVGADRDAADVNDGGRVYTSDPVEIDDDDHFGGDDDWSIRVYIPDMNDAEDSGFNGPMAGDTLVLVFSKAAGIKNPSEETSNSVGYSVLGPDDKENDGPQVQNHGDDDMYLKQLLVKAEISLSDEDNSRGYELTVTGSGFNNGTSAAVHVLHNARYHTAVAWEDLDCAGMKKALGKGDSETNEACFHFDLDTKYMTYKLSDPLRAHDDFKALSDDDKQMYVDMVFDSGLMCRTILQEGSREGIATVGSDDKVAVSFEVTVPTFQAGDQNYICMVDGEGRSSSTDVEQFKLEPSIRIVPSSAAAGDTVTVFAQDYPNTRAGFSQLKIAGQDVTGIGDKSTNIGDDGSGTVTFDLPGSLSGSALEGTVRIDARWGGVAPFDEDKGVTEDTKITITGSSLTLSKSEALANELITITGDGFGGDHIDVSKITIDGVALMVHDDSQDDDTVEVSNAGQFVASVVLWPETEGSNPQLIAGTHTIKVEDNAGFSGSAVIIIPEPSISVTPSVAGPRDIITITGENWPIDNVDGADPDAVDIRISDGNRDRRYSAFADSAGRFTIEHRVASNVAIPSTNQVRAEMSTDIVKVGSFEVPAAIINVEPAEGQPGDHIMLSVDGMPVYQQVDRVEIGGRNVRPVGNFSTDAHGSVTVDDVLIPGIDPGTYSVLLEVDDTIAIGELNVLAEAGVIGPAAMLPDAVEDLGDSLVAIFHFDDVGKVWSFYDPRPEFSDLNTLTEMVGGEAYWILVSETVDEVVLNNKVRSLTCRGDDCWNLEVW